MNKKVTELEKELTIKSEEKFRNLAESLSELVYRADPETLVATYVNKSIEEIYGYTVEEWLNKPELWEKTMHPDDKERVFAKIKEAQNKYEPIITEYKIIRKDAGVRWVRDRISWEKDQQGAVVALTGVLYDITERIELEKKLIEKMEELLNYYKMSGRKYRMREITEEIEELTSKLPGYKK